jgi:DNA polymerase III delta prime subunit
MVQEIIGHKGSIKFLDALLKRNVQSFLLVGPEGIGKKTVACALAKKLLCEKNAQYFI